MSILLKVMGGITLLVSLVEGSGNSEGFLYYLVPGLFGAAFCFGIAMLLDGQAEIKARLRRLESESERKKPVEKKVCLQCGKEYDAECNSCPYCGARK